MKITKTQLKQIIKEELREALGESYRQHRGGVYGTGDSSSMETEGPSGDAGLQLAQALEQKLEASDMSTGWAWDQEYKRELILVTKKPLIYRLSPARPPEGLLRLVNPSGKSHNHYYLVRAHT